MIRSVFIAVLTLWVSITTVRGAEEKPVFIALDAEFGLPNSTSAQSIKLGIDTAVREINAAGGVLIPAGIDQNRCAHSLIPMDIIFDG